MNSEFLVLAGTAASLGFIHTILGPDHYVPFVAMSKVRGWTWKRTALITFLCGLGHVLGSVVLGLAGVLLGAVVFSLESIESFRGDLAAWLLIQASPAPSRSMQVVYVYENVDVYEYAA